MRKILEIMLAVSLVATVAYCTLWLYQNSESDKQPSQPSTEWQGDE